MANRDSNNWPQSIPPDVDVSDAYEQSQDPENAYVHPSFAEAARVARRAYEASLRHQQRECAIHGSRSSSQGETDHNLDPNLDQAFISNDYVSPYQQGNQAHWDRQNLLGHLGPQENQMQQMRQPQQVQQQAYWNQQAPTGHSRPQGNQRQLLPQGPFQHQTSSHYVNQQYERQPGANLSPSFYPSNTSSRRALNQPPKPSWPVSAQEMNMPTQQQAPTSRQVPNARNPISDSSHLRPARPPSQTVPPSSKSPAIPTTAPTSMWGSSSSSAPFLPHSTLIAPPQGKRGRPVEYPQEALPLQDREKWANGLPPADTPPDTSDSPRAPSGAVQEPGGWKAPNPRPQQQHQAPQPQPPTPSIAPSSSKASGAVYASASQAKVPPVKAPPAKAPPPGRRVDDTRGPPAKMQRLSDGSRHAVKTPSGTSRLSQYLYQAPSRGYIKYRGDLAQPIDAADADIKESYDPATIARDVLINADKHPTEPNLNYHLEVLTRNLPSVNTSSDLDTIRWDLLDPDVSRDDAGHRSLARAESRPSNTLGALPFVPPSYQSRPYHFSPSPAPAFKSPAFQPPPFTTPAFRPPPQALPAPSPSPRSPPRAPPLLTRPASTYKPPSVPTSTPTPVSQPAAGLPADSKVTPTPAPAPPIQPAAPSSSSSRRASKSSRSKAPSQSPRHSRTPIQVVIPSTSHRMPPRKKGQVGRPKKTPLGANNVEVAIQHEPTVPYQIFHCKWTDCQAELHNLHALQNHVLKVHIPHNLTCGWGECDDRTPRAAADMWEHTKQHIEKVGWSLGDGPAVPASADKQPDPSGFKLSLRNPRPETMTLPANENMIDTFSRVHGAYNHKQKAEKFREGGNHWKEETGVDTDMSDRSLCHPAMQPLVQDKEMAITISSL